MDIFSMVKYADESLFRVINRQWSAEWLDGIMQLLRYQFTWVPLYVFLLYWFYKNTSKSNKNIFLLIIFFSILTFALTDYISASMLKPFFSRVRPCYEPALNARLLIGCGGTYGMPSSHASNHFGLAAFWYMLLMEKFNRKWYWLWIWAFVICYAQVYVGKHYPGDIILGGLFGTCVGLVTHMLFNFALSYFFNRKKRGYFRYGKRIEIYDR